MKQLMEPGTGISGVDWGRLSNVGKSLLFSPIIGFLFSALLLFLLGRPNYHVKRFQRIAAIRSAKIMAKPAPVPTRKMSSTGKSDTTPNATAPVEVRTPMKVQTPDHTTAM
jgi:phosphate/sulfate permease